jgi:uncharacterized linocin/CFP29 family protein
VYPDTVTPTNAATTSTTPYPWELNEGQLARLGWTDFYWTSIRPVAHEEATSARKVRPAIPLFGQSNDPNAHPNTVHDYRLNVGPPLNVPDRQPLVSAEIRCPFRISSEQKGDERVAQALVRAAAHRVGRGEDAVEVLGRDASSALQSLKLTSQNLAQQTSRLIGPRQAAVGQPILNSIIKAMQALQTRGYFGDYWAIVAPDLYREAFQPQTGPLDAPIHAIRPLLSEEGFRYSPAVPPTKGVLMSIGGGTVHITVPRDVHVRWAEEGRDITLEVATYFRLLIIDDGALEPLQ